MSVKRVTGPGAAKLEAMIAGLKNAQMKVGWVDQAKYEDGTPVAYAAAISEFGSPEQSIPPRPTMRPTVTRDEKMWKSLTAKALKADPDSVKALELLGEVAAGGIRKSISAVTAPPLSPVTLRLRFLRNRGDKITGKTVGEAHQYAYAKDADLGGVSTKPLVDSGLMIASVGSVVEKL